MDSKIMTQTKQQKTVCLGGGIGTVNLIRGLKAHTPDITVVVSMADEGGSSGRLRRLYNIMPPGDIISCVAALVDKDHELYSKLLTYRFPGDRYDTDNVLSGHKLGNLLMVAARDITGNFHDAISLLKNMFDITGNILPATNEDVSLSATTVDGMKVEGEEAIDLGKYAGNRVLDRVSITPENPSVPPGVLTAIKEADVIIAGPGDLYTTILPVLIIPDIKNALITATQAAKVFVVNVANKPFETKGYDVSDFISAVRNHLGIFPFSSVVVNNNFSIPIPERFQYTYVTIDKALSEATSDSYKIVQADLVDEKFPLYHDSEKLAELLSKTV